MIGTFRKLFGVDGPAAVKGARFARRAPGERMVATDQLMTTSVIGQVMVVTILERTLSGEAVFDLAHSITELYGRQASVRHIVLDMENVAYVDSSGLSALVDLASVVKPRSGKIAIAAATQQVEVLFKLTRLELVFGIRRTTLEAIAAVEHTN